MDRILRRLICSFSIVFVSSYAFAVEEQLPVQVIPNDEAVRDPTLVEFRDQLLSIVRAREHERIVNMIDPRINNGPDVPRGAKAFASKWDLGNVDSELWPTLEAILKLGGGFIRSEIGVEFCAPYVFTDFPGEYSRFKHGVILDSNVKMHMEPNSASDLVALLSYDVVRVPSWNAVPDANKTPNLLWFLIKTLDGKMGYVQASFIRSPAQYSACFLQRDEKTWKIISLMSR